MVSILLDRQLPYYNADYPTIRDAQIELVFGFFSYFWPISAIDVLTVIRRFFPIFARLGLRFGDSFIGDQTEMGMSQQHSILMT